MSVQGHKGQAQSCHKSSESLEALFPLLTYVLKVFTFRDLLARAGFESGIVASDLQTEIQWKMLGRKEYISCESSLQIYVACWKISFLWGHLYFNGGNEF